MRHLLFILMIIISSSVFGQEKVTIIGKVQDAESGQAVPGVHIWAEKLARGAYSKRDGSFELKVNWKPGASVEFTAIGYEKKRLDLDEYEEEIKDNILRLDVQLEFDVVLLKGSEITTAPDTVYGSKEYHVGDFCFTDDGMFLLTFEKEERWKRQEDAERTLYKNCQLVLLDEFDRELDVLDLPNPASYFYTDYLDEVFLVSEHRVDHVSRIGNRINLSPISNQEFEDLIKPVLDSIESQVFVCNYAADFPSFEYYVYDKEDTTFQTLRNIVDKPLMDLFRSEYKYLSGRGKLEAFRYEIKTGIDKEVVAAYMSGFANSIYYESLYAPLYVTNDTALVFDHYNDKIYKYVSPTDLVDSVSIDYHRPKRRNEWQKEIIQDYRSGDMFGLFKRNGWYYLKMIDTDNGDVTMTFKLLHRYAENIRVKNGWAYYVYRPFESSQKKFLYKEQILGKVASDKKS